MFASRLVFHARFSKDLTDVFSQTLQLESFGWEPMILFSLLVSFARVPHTASVTTLKKKMHLVLLVDITVVFFCLEELALCEVCTIDALDTLVATHSTLLTIGRPVVFESKNAFHVHFGSSHFLAVSLWFQVVLHGSSKRKEIS